MFSFTKTELHSFYERVVQITADKIGIGDSQFKSSRELLDEIKNANNNVHVKLKAFIAAYDKWYEGVVEGKEKSRDAVLQLINEKDSARNALLKSLL